MPCVTPQTRSASAYFGIPNSRLPPGVDPASFLIYTPEQGEKLRPQELLNLQLHDLRDELDSPEGPGEVADQVYKRGFGIAKHDSKFVDSIHALDGTRAYIDETCQLMKSYLGCTKVVQWNSTVRRADTQSSKVVKRQTGPEKDFVPTTRIQPPAGHAHVDQDELWAPNVVRMATGQDPTVFKRSIIINIWRPLKGPVTNSPLCLLDFRTFNTSDTSKQESQFGTGIQIHFAPSQKWTYIRHQMPDELVVLMCYDSDQGKDGGALYVGHVAASGLDDSEGVEEALVRPRESIEVRMVAVWE